MTHGKRVRFYLDRDTRRRAEQGDHNFIGRVARVLREAKFDISYHNNTKVDRLLSGLRDGFSLSEMTPPPNANGLTFRRVYHYPFWQIQRSDKRWEWDVARTTFDPGFVPRPEADQFFERWKNRVCGPLAREICNDGYIYMPLQGRLLDCRSFQTCSPIEMVKYARAARPGDRIVAALHPKETYSAAERTALAELTKHDPLLEVTTGQRDTLLPRCTFVVTMTSSVAFDAMFFGKPAITFGQTDFDHVMVKGSSPDAFEVISDHHPDYAAYIWWVWQHMAINAGHKSAEAKIRSKLIAAGWPVG